MLIRMRPVLIIGFLLFSTPATCRADISCSHPVQLHSAAEAIQIRNQLLAIKVGWLTDDMPAPSPERLEEFKIALMQTAETVFACNDTSSQPAAMQRELAGLLHANRHVPPTRYSDADTEKPSRNVFGSDLRVRVSRASAMPLILSVQFTFGINCGTDSVLMLFQSDQGRWKDVLRWRVKSLQGIQDAFGDFFYPFILPGESPGAWRLVAVHGEPWCSSNLSGFAIDVLAPTNNPDAPKLIAHRTENYFRYEPPKLSISSNTFTLHTDVGTGEMEEIVRKGVFRYQLTNDKLQGIQPIATNGRYFVNEWLEMPWDDAIRFSEPSALTALKPAHDLYAARDADPKNFVSYNFGPVRSCQDNPKQFQVEQEEGTDGKQLPVYYLIRETGNGYQLLSVEPQSDPHCGGPDLMKKK